MSDPNPTPVTNTTAASTQPVPAHTAAAAHGVIAKLESELEKEFAKGEAQFKVWLKATLTELKQHLKV